MCKVHPWTPETTYVDSGGKRCRVCLVAYKRAWYRKHRERILRRLQVMRDSAKA